MTVLRPGTVVSVSAAPPTRGVDTPTGVLFLPHFYEWGVANTPYEITSMADFADTLGDRLAHSYAYDAAEFYFSIGGKKIIASRVVGPTPVAATANLFDAAGSVDPGDVALLATLKGKYAHDNGFNIEVVAGGGNFEITITHDDLDIEEESGTLADRAAAVAWSATSEYVTLTLGASNEDPRTQGPTSFAGGDDDYANATDATEWQAAKDAITRDYGPGQVIAAGRTTDAIHNQLLAHAADNNRHAIIDFADGASVATMTTAVATCRTASDENCRYGRAYSSWLDMPGLSSAPGTTRTMPPSAIVAGLLARNDGLGLSPNIAAAGTVNGVVAIANGVEFVADTKWTPAEIDELNTGGVNAITEIDGQVVLYGNRTMVDPDGAEAAWLDASNSRLAMAIAAEADTIAQRFVFALLDGQRRTIGRYGGELRSMLMAHVESGALFVDPDDPRPETAYTVDVDSANTAETMAAGELHATIGLRMSPHAELVYVTIVKRAITEAVA